MINDERKELYIRPYLKVYNSENDVASLELRKRSSGRNEIDAMKKTEDLIYNYSITETHSSWMNISQSRRDENGQLTILASTFIFLPDQ